jgi:hypothetical protein
MACAAATPSARQLPAFDTWLAYLLNCVMLGGAALRSYRGGVGGIKMAGQHVIGCACVCSAATLPPEGRGGCPRIHTAAATPALLGEQGMGCAAASAAVIPVDTRRGTALVHAPAEKLLRPQGRMCSRPHDAAWSLLGDSSVQLWRLPTAWPAVVLDSLPRTRLLVRWCACLPALAPFGAPGRSIRLMPARFPFLPPFPSSCCGGKARAAHSFPSELAGALRAGGGVPASSGQVGRE